jgi:REP element-mobilizing transposase RayT
MGYPIREEIPGCYYHVGTRGNNQRPIYRDAGSRVMFLVRLGIIARRFDWEIAAYCLMTNHYHFVVKLGQSGMARGMQALNGGYAIAFNARYGRRDHLFGRRYWSRELEDEDDMLETCRYIELNPVRKAMTRLPEDWRWSSHRAAVGIASPDPLHSPHAIWSLFDDEPRIAMSAYERFVKESLLETRPVSDTGVPPEKTQARR